MPNRSTLTYDTGRGLKSRQVSSFGLEFQAATAFALALALGGAALVASSTIFGAAALLGIAALVARAALTVLAADPAGDHAVRPGRQAGLDALLALVLGLTAVLLAALGDIGAAASAGAGAALLGLLQLRTRYLAA